MYAIGKKLKCYTFNIFIKKTFKILNYLCYPFILLKINYKPDFMLN